MSDQQAQQSYSLMGQAFTMQMNLDVVQREFLHRVGYHRLNNTLPIDHLAERRKAGELGPRAKAAWKELERSMWEHVDVRSVAALLLNADFTVEQASDMIALYVLKEDTAKA